MTPVLAKEGRKRSELAGAGAILATAIFVAVIVHQRPVLVGSYVDDGIYLATSKSLATGHGYRHLELPGEPYQTKYPILYPALLAAIWRVAPEFPQNLSLVQYFNVGLWAIGSWCAYRSMRRAWGVPIWLALAAVVLSFTTVATLSVLQTAMSEPLYFGLSMAALLLASPATHGITERNAATAHVADAAGVIRRKREIFGALGVGVLVAAAYLTRSIAVTLAAALLISQLWRRRWLAAGFIALGTAAAGGAWSAWRTWATGQNAAIRGVKSLSYDLDYSLWLAPIGTHLWIAWQNLWDVLLSTMLSLVQIDQTAVLQALWKGPKQAAWILVALGLLNLVVLVGAVATWNRRAPAAHLYVLAYLALVLIWPFEPARFLIVLFPLLFGWFLAGIYTSVVGIVSLTSGAPRRKTPRSDTQAATPLGRRSTRKTADLESALPSFARVLRRPDTEAALPVTLLVAAGLAFIQIAPLLGADAASAQLSRTLEEREALVTIIRTQTPPNAVISGLLGGYLHLRTGRKFVPPLPGDNQIPLYYPPDRPFWACGRGATPSMQAASARFTRERLIGFLRDTGATYVVPMRLDERPTYALPFAELVREYPGKFARIGGGGEQTPDGRSAGYELYRVSIP